MRSAPSPYTTYVMAGSSWAASSSTYESSGAPASGCMTLGRSDCMRVPRPAARITIESGASLGTRSLPCAICDLPLKCALAFELAQPFDHFQLRYGPRQLGQRLGLRDLVDLARQGVLGPLSRR